MDNKNLKYICNSLIDTFLVAGDRSIELRKIGLKKEIKSDNTPVTNADIEVNEILIKKIKSLTPDIATTTVVSDGFLLNPNELVSKFI